MNAISVHGLLGGMPGWLQLLVLVGVFGALAFRGARLWQTTVAVFAALLLFGAPVWLWVVLGVPMVVLVLPPLRRVVLSNRILAAMKRLGLLPRISDTERQAIEAGTVWLDADLFSGRPDLAALAKADWPELDERSGAFLDGPVTEVCRMTDDWQVFQNRDLPPEVWEKLADERFFGMIIPERYGGLGFSASANSAVVGRLAARSLPLAITVMVPNSLGPAELLIHYGTEDQREHWLPRLARGDEIPAFALTEPTAGSDAGALRAEGVVFRDDQGRVMLRLQWEKRYITLASVATVLGLAFRVRDPEGILGGEADLGITCALIPTDTRGVDVSRRHDPMGIPFVNCPTTGEDVVVPLDEAVIGGRDGVGRGWQMLMECLAAGRGISLPATSTGGAQLVARAVGAHAAVRKQFGLEIGRFEGIEEPLGRIAGQGYLLEAARRLTCGGLDRGAKPAVVTALAKYHFTETYRQVINDGMDVLGGNGISRGPRNVLAHGYTGCPISITVEGANILTRTLMIFGQGAIRCHPFAYEEIEALRTGDRRRFDRAFWGHVGHVLRNAARAALLSVSRGWLARPPVSGPMAPYWRRLAWTSASFAHLADLAMATVGADLKRKEKLTGRYADVLSWMYFATAVLRRFEAEGRRSEDLPLARWALEHCFGRIQEAFGGILRNFHVPVLGALCRGPLYLWHQINAVGRGPGDRLGSAVAKTLLRPGAQRERLTALVPEPAAGDPGLGRLEMALELCTEVEPLVRKVKDAARSGTLRRAPVADLIDEAVEAGVLDADEGAAMRRAEEARREAITVDSFTAEEYHGTALEHAAPAEA